MRSTRPACYAVIHYMAAEVRLKPIKYPYTVCSVFDICEYLASICFKLQISYEVNQHVLVKVMGTCS